MRMHSAETLRIHIIVRLAAMKRGRPTAAAAVRAEIHGRVGLETKVFFRTQLPGVQSNQFQNGEK